MFGSAFGSGDRICDDTCKDVCSEIRVRGVLLLVLKEHPERGFRPRRERTWVDSEFD